MLGNPIVAATQVLVYIGAISVLILFAIMLTQTKNAPVRLVFQTQAWAAAVAAVVVGAVIVAAILATTWPAEDHVSRHVNPGRRPAALPRLRAAVRGRVSVLLTAGRGRRRLPGPPRARAREEDQL